MMPVTLARGWLTTKIHLTADGAGRGLAVLLTPVNQRLPAAAVAARRGGCAATGRWGAQPRHPEVVIADRADSSASNRTLLNRKRIQTMIPERRD
ncbi:hypothetical protein [Nocardia sp. NPDC005825]|uniref:hypothetical protein n=1 Tax=unclassified Nocardia TaxID=2637762 RepID=UPI0034089C21